MDETSLILPGAFVPSVWLHEVILSSTLGGSGTELVLMQPQAPRPVPCRDLGAVSGFLPVSAPALTLRGHRPW